MKVILPPIIAVILILVVSIFLSYFSLGIEWGKSEAEFDILSPLFLIRNGILIILGIAFSFLFSGGFASDEERKPEIKFLLPIIIGIASAGILILLLKQIWYPRGTILSIIAYILIWVVSEELFFRSFLAKSMMSNSNPLGPNIVALFVSSIIYAFWNITYYPILANHNFMEILANSLLFFVVVALPITGTYYYTRSLISSGICNLIIKAGFIIYTMCVISI